MRRLSIELLDGADPLTGDLAERHNAAWGHLYTNWTSAKALAEFCPQKTDGSLPATLVLREDGQVADSVSVLYGDCEVRAHLAVAEHADGSGNLSVFSQDQCGR